VAGSSGISSSLVDNGCGLEILIFQRRQRKRFIAARAIIEYQYRNKLDIIIATKCIHPNTQLMAEAASLKVAYAST